MGQIQKVSRFVTTNKEEFKTEKEANKRQAEINTLEKIEALAKYFCSTDDIMDFFREDFDKIHEVFKGHDLQ